MIDPVEQTLIRQLSLENPLWGAPRIHGELVKIGYEVAEVRRRVAHWNVTNSSTTAWNSQQLIQAFTFETAQR